MEQLLSEILAELKAIREQQEKLIELATKPTVISDFVTADDIDESRFRKLHSQVMNRVARKMGFDI